MKHVVMGTAGHIDHGKTTLVKCLTGVDTDRLKEEKIRGMTIELGFAPMKLPSGAELSIVDVPGHEKFVKTMVAGAAGIDFALLVIAADEGIMPQTEEHIDILKLLGVKGGITAITKSDLVDETEIEKLKEEIREYLEQHWMDGVPIIPISAQTGRGIDDLIRMIDELTAKASREVDKQLFRMPVDRAFSMTGYGTVITGTISGGTVARGQMVDVLPEGLKAKVRGIQVHNNQVEEAIMGDRCALNLAGLDKSKVGRGSVVAEAGMVEPVNLVDALLISIKDKEEIKHNQRVHVNIGTKEVLARIRLIGTDRIPSGETGYGQIRFEEPIVALRGDTFIIRNYSPVNTIGGGRVLFHYTENRKRSSQETLQFFKMADSQEPKKLLEHILEESDHLINIAELYRFTLEDKEKIRDVLQYLLHTGCAGYIKEVDKYFSTTFYLKAIEAINAEFQRLQAMHPYRFQITKEELKSRVFPQINAKDYTAFMNYLAENHQFRLKENAIQLTENELADSIFEKKEVAEIRNYLKNQQFNCFTARMLADEKGINIKQAEEILNFLQAVRLVEKLDENQYIEYVALTKAAEALKKALDERGSITVAMFRDLLNTGRKTAMLILEYFDSVKVTYRDGDIRKPGIRYTDHLL